MLELLVNGMIRQMDLVTMSLPDQVPEIEFDELGYHLASNSPAIFPQAANDLGITASAEELLDNIKDYTVNVALTPMGNADSPLGDQFVQPCQVEMTVKELLACLASKKEDLVFYMQSQDDNLNKEFSNCTLIPRDLNALKQKCPLLEGAGEPEACNIWIGGERTRSRLHNDNYDNIFVQLSGQKRVYLIPPAHVYGVHEKFLCPKRYELREDGTLVLVDDLDLSCNVLFPTVDPSDVNTHDESFRSCKVYSVDLNEGDALFIPALWYHQVEILSSKINISVNYWFTPKSQTALWPMWDYLRMTSLVTRGYYDENYFVVH